jgi:hypothetical protein
LSQQSVVSAAPFFDSNGHASFCGHLTALARANPANLPTGLALALPFEVDYQRDLVASNWRGGWPDRVRAVEGASR